MTEVEGNLEPVVIENGEIKAELTNGDISLDISVESQDEKKCENVEVNGIKSDSENDDCREKEPTLVPLKDESGTSSPRSPIVAGKVRKSSMERLLEETLNTMEDPDNDVFVDRNSSFSSQGSMDSNNCNPSSKPRKTSIYEQKQIKAPNVSRGNIIASRTENLFKNYERDMTVHEPRPMININDDVDIGQLNTNDEQKKIDIARAEKERELLEIRKQYQQRLIDEENERAAARSKKAEEKLNTNETYDEDGDVFIERPASSPSSSRASISSLDEDGAPKRRTSVYEQKQIEAPASMKGNVIASRTQNLLKQYEKDLETQSKKPVIDLTEGVEENTESEEKRLELQEIKLQYQKRIQEEERERIEKVRRNSENEVKSRKSLGAHMNRYIALTKGESVQHSSDEEDEKDGEDNSLYVDKHGVKIERGGGKIEIVKSSDSISSLKNKFGGSSDWKKTEVETPSDEVDAGKVRSAFSAFKEKETIKEEKSSFNRPKSKKVRDPKVLMEMRKQATYGNEDELPQDGVVTKSVVIEKEELDTTVKHHALNVYKNLEKKEDNALPLNKPKTKLLSDVEAQATLEGIRSISSSTSEASDINETTNDLTVDTVSGYGSAAPCSPSSVLSEDYLSDHKDESPREELKDDNVIICDKEPTLNLEVSADLTVDDVSLVKCQSEVSNENITETVGGV